MWSGCGVIIILLVCSVWGNIVRVAVTEVCRELEK